MEDYKVYVVAKEEKLSSIAEKFNTTPEKIKSVNPSLRTFGGFIEGVYVSVGQRIKIPSSVVITNAKVISEEYANLEFEQKARYRCEQVNTSSMNGNLIHFAEQKHQFLLKQSLEEELKGFVKMEEIIYNFTPPTLNQSFNILSKTELIRHNVYFSISPEKGNIKKILNK